MIHPEIGDWPVYCTKCDLLIFWLPKRWQRVYEAIMKYPIICVGCTLKRIRRRAKVAARRAGKSRPA